MDTIWLQAYENDRNVEISSYRPSVDLISPSHKVKVKVTKKTMCCYFSKIEDNAAKIDAKVKGKIAV